MPIVEIKGKKVKFPDMSPEELAKAVKASVEQIKADPLKAKERVIQLAKIAAPIGVGVATGGMGAVPALGAAALAGGASEAGAQIAQRAIGSEQAPKTSGEAAVRIGKEAGLNALFEGAGRGIAAAGKKVVGWMRGWAPKRAAAQSAGATAEELSRVYDIHPEVVEPGYFNQRIDTFTADLPKKVAGGFEKHGTAMQKALSKEGTKPVMRVNELQRGVEEALSKLSGVQTPDAEQAAKAVKSLTDELLSKNKIDPMTGKGGDISAGDIVKFESDMWELTKRGGKDVKNATGKLRLELDKKLESMKELTKARQGYKAYRQSADVLEDFMGITPKSSPAEVATRVEAVSNRFLAMPEPVKDAIRKALTDVDASGKLVERLEKLAAAGGGEGRLTASQPLLPTMGVGNVGWSVANPGAAAGALGATAAVRSAASAPVVRALFKVAKSGPVTKALLPGLGQIGQVARAVRLGRKYTEKE